MKIVSDPSSAMRSRVCGRRSGNARSGWRPVRSSACRTWSPTRTRLSAVSGRPSTGPRSGPEEDPVDHHPVTGPPATPRRIGGQESPQPLPFLVSQVMAIQSIRHCTDPHPPGIKIHRTRLNPSSSRKQVLVTNHSCFHPLVIVSGDPLALPARETASAPCFPSDGPSDGSS
jgi:hypothetical protein